MNPDLLRLLPADARLVVAVGCGAGALPAENKRLNPHARYVGIEANPDAAQLAHTRQDHVTVWEVEQLDATALGITGGTVDGLVYGDVLEHLLNPWAVQRRHAGWLWPGGWR